MEYLLQLSLISFVMNNNRILYIDYAKAIAMILVIIGHINFANQDIKPWIYAFHMPVFFFCTGLVLNGDTFDALAPYFKKRFQRLIIPYTLWALIFAKLTIINMIKIAYGGHRSLISAGSLSSLWFLPVMFDALILFYVYLRYLPLNKSSHKLLVSTISLIIGFALPSIRQGYPWGIDVSFVAVSFLLLGNLARPYLDRGCELLDKSYKTVIKLFLLLVLLCVGTMAYSMNNPDKGYVLMAEARYGNPLLFLWPAICGIFLLVLISIMLQNFTGNIKWLSFIGQNTLCIFAVQKPIISCIGILYKHIHLPSIMVLISTTVVVTVLSCGMTVLVNKYIPVLAGKK